MIDGRSMHIRKYFGFGSMPFFIIIKANRNEKKDAQTKWNEYSVCTQNEK